MDYLRNYRQLVERVDGLNQRILQDYPEQIHCHPGCDSCCRHLALFWVEGVALSFALRELPRDEAEHIRQRARCVGPDDPCPLLEGGRCLLYAARPLICRTHGLPLLGQRDGERFVDVCPKNFQGIAQLPPAAVLDLDRLNVTLASVNSLFVAEAFGSEKPATERVFIAEALLLEF
ncbi:MAG: YkgJ family cysteine cluster protein [Desulfuromonadaceae bacterium]